MNQPIDADTRAALASLLEDALPSDEQAALEKRIQTEPEVCEAFAALLRQDVLMGEISAESRYQQTPETSVAPKTTSVAFNRKRAWILASAACVALAMISWVALRGSQLPTETAVLSLLTGEAQVLRNGTSLVATEGMTLQTGDLLDVVGKDARTEVRFADGSRISAEQGTRWAWSPSLAVQPGARNIDLRQGALSALIEKQTGSNTYYFITREARVTVTGTRFRFSNIDTTSTLELYEGSVRFQRNSDRQEIVVTAGQRVAAGRDTTVALTATPLNPPSTVTPPQKSLKALLVTAEPLPFFAHDVALQRALQKLGFEVELITFDRVTTVEAEAKDLVVVPSHRCNHTKVLRDVTKPLIAFHNEWHRDLGLLSYDAPADHALKLRSVSWSATLAEEFKALAKTTQPAYALSVYSSLPDAGGGIPVVKLNETPARSPLVLFAKGPTASAGPRVAFSIDIREGAGSGAPVEISDELFSATVRWCLAQKEATK